MVNSLSAYTRISPPVVYLMGLVVRKWLFDTQASRCWEREETRIEKLAQFGDAKPFNHLGIILNLVRLTARNSANFSLSFQFAPKPQIRLRGFRSSESRTSFCSHFWQASFGILSTTHVMTLVSAALPLLVLSLHFCLIFYPCHDSCSCSSSAPRPLSP